MADQNTIWLVEPIAAADDPWWQGRPIWQLAVTAPSAAFARMEAERWAVRGRQRVPVGNESRGLSAGFIDTRLYHVHPMPDGAGFEPRQVGEDPVVVLAGPMASKARA